MAPPVPLPRIDRPGMRFIVYGAGAVGVVVEARLFQSGYNVLPIARGAHHHAIRRAGLRAAVER